MLRRSARPLALVALAAALAVSSATLRAASTSRKSPFVQVVGEGVVVTVPKEKSHKNGRRFLEFDVTLSTARMAADQPAGADRSLTIDTKGRVHIVHDRTCGGAAITLVLGDRVEIGGEYVHVENGRDLIHFTHPADGSCGRGGSHPAGFLRKIVTTTPTPHALTTPRPGVLVPDQPVTGPAATGKPYEAILAAREKGVSNAELKARVEKEGVAYSLTTPDIQKLRAAGVSSDVIAAMMRSGRTPSPGVAVTSTPTTSRN